ncbi:chemotaxis protein CheW [Acetivibrio clariflavus]|uniref:Chemotaxis signal transduction protein n=1 Tax=Acetivibrio clariflavus (strain DSM 19732 / NBRC 101661 / EBR45) TaxID=720554 RepID=G8LVF3_ACECE|nr:chemotaxis protein CheW [Acetivibrio clariflavus]AEV68542.1 chemotaxis signal transduction protein [Acetivibrio clariflavus DSM 19732]
MGEVVNVDGKQYVVFLLDKENYGVEIHSVTTIEKMLPYARVPKTPDYIKGVINLRGEIVPIMDIRTRFGMEAREETEETRIIIIKINDVSFGIIVDEVDEVLTLNEEAIENVSNFTNDVSMDYILGVGKIDGRIVTLLNIEKLADISN